MSGTLTANKQKLVTMIEDLERASPDRIAEALDLHCHTDCVWNIFHPFNRMDGNAAAADRFWAPLASTFPDWEYRPACALGGEYEGYEQVSSWGHIMGTMAAPWLNVPANLQLSFLRFGINGQLRDGKFARIYILLDLIDLMRQAGHYPLREMPGSAEQWPFPPAEAGLAPGRVDPMQGEKTLGIVLEMQYGLPRASDVTDIESASAAHSPHWHNNMNWYGPAGIGSSRGLRGFRDYHGALFLKAFPDRSGIERKPAGPPDRPGDYIRLGDGRFAVTAGLPAMRATHTGGQWLGLPPTGAAIEMRVADWYRLDRDDKIIDNWVMIDIPHILDQMGLDIFDDVQFFADRSIPRLRPGG